MTFPLPIDALREKQVDVQPYPLLFVTISGAHLYGFPSADSDFDLRGAHILPLDEVVRLAPGRETIEVSGHDDGLQIDLVTHDVKKFFGMLLKKNGYVLEQLYSPLIVRTSSEHSELKRIASACITRHHVHHYLGFADTQWRLFSKESPRRVKPLLYVYRVLLTGIHLMRTGRVEANLVTLHQEARLAHVNHLIARKLTGQEQSILPASEWAFHDGEYARLRRELEIAAERSHLPDHASAARELDALLVRIRLAG
jgi:predicted nucleotidyltransferase